MPAIGLVIWLLRMRSLTWAICAAADVTCAVAVWRCARRRLDLLRLRLNLAVLRLDLIVLRLDLLLEHARVPLGLIELLRRRRLLREETLRALVDAAGDLALRFERGALRPGRVPLRRGGIPLGLQHVDLLGRPR